MTADYQNIARELLNDPEVRKELAQATTLNEAADIAVRLAQQRGYNITSEDLQNAFTPPNGELSDAELETVVGGKTDADGNKEIKGDSGFFAQWAAFFGATTGEVFADDIEGGDGNDSLYGGWGNDTIHGGEGNDSMDGGWGYDDQEDGDDYLDGGSGNDTMWGGGGQDELHGGDDNDQVSGNEGDDTLYGEAGNDKLFGGEGNDELYGGTGNDYLEGGEGDDVLDGGSGSDTLVGGAGHDILTGGDGSDLFFFTNDSGTDLIKDFDANADRIRFSGASSINDISVVSGEGRTYIEYGESTIILEGVEMTAEQVWSRRG